MTSGEPLFGRCLLADPRVYGGDDEIGAVWDITRLDEDRLLVTDLYAPPYLKVLSRATGRVTHAFGPEGEGPGELVAPWSAFASSARPGVIEIFDKPSGRLNFFGAEPGEAFSWLGGRRFLVHARVEDITPYGEGYVGEGLFADYTLVVVDSTGRTMERLVSDPPFDPAKTGIPAGIAPLLGDANFAVSGSRVAVAYRFEPYVDLVDLDDRTYRRVIGPEPAPTRFEVRNGGLQLSDDNVGAYANITVTDRLILATFSGYTYAETWEHLRERPNDYFEHISHVFDWQGRYLAEIDTEHDFNGMELDPEHRYLWTDHEDPFPRVVEWPLPPIIDLLERLDRGEPASDLELCPAGRYGG